MRHRNVVVLGGSGFVGRYLVNALVERGCAVIVPTRQRERAKALFLLPRVRIEELDVRDSGALTQLATGADAVINLVGLLNESGRASFVDAHVGITESAIRACRANNITRLLHMSALNASPHGPSRYLQTKGDAEARVAASGLDWTVFQPSVIFGPEDRFVNLFGRIARWMPVLLLARDKARFQPVFVGDVATAMSLALDDKRTFGQRYALCGPKVYTLREVVAYAAKQAGHRPVLVGLPDPVARVQACVMEHLPGKLLTRDNLESMRVDSVCDCPYPVLFGTPRAMEDIVPQYLSPSAADPLSVYRRRHR